MGLLIPDSSRFTSLAAGKYILATLTPIQRSTVATTMRYGDAVVPVMRVAKSCKPIVRKKLNPSARDESITSKSDVNLFRILPVGVVSCQEVGA